MEMTIALADDGASIAEARHRAAAFPARGHPAGVSERIVGLTQLVVSELVTNHVRARPRPCAAVLGRRGGKGHGLGHRSPAAGSLASRRPTGGSARSGDREATAQELTVDRETVGKRITARIPLDV
jgi:hypothetical protein